MLSTVDGPYAETKDMYTVHIMLRREFRLLPELVRGVAAGDEKRARIVADHIAILVELLGAHHHSEDVVLWPRLLDRAPDEVAPVVQLMEGHHTSMEKLDAEIESMLRAWRENADPEQRRALASTLDRLLLVLTEHTGLEERLILPVVEKHISKAEWEQMVAESGAGISPERIPLIIGMMMYEGGLEIVPPEARDAMKDIGPQVYAAHSERVHGTATPVSAGV